MRGIITTTGITIRPMAGITITGTHTPITRGITHIGIITIIRWGTRIMRWDTRAIITVHRLCWARSLRLRSPPQRCCRQAITITGPDVARRRAKAALQRGRAS